MIPVTKPILSDLEKFVEHLRDIWRCGVLTNQGEKAKLLELRLAQFLGTQNLYLVGNGTWALHIALRCLGVRNKKVLTTPFSFVATTSAAVWEGAEVIFADIKKSDLTIDEEKVEQQLIKHPDIGVILATHVYGFPCAVDRLGELSRHFDVPIVYDAAHAFGVRVGSKTILDYGDVSTLSFHATKVFHSVEGGAVVSSSKAYMERMRLLRNFGCLSPESFDGAGTNAKLSELHAAMGLAVLDLIPEAITLRKNLSSIYDSLLFTKDLRLSKPSPEVACSQNYSYYPIIFPDEQSLLAVKGILEQRGVTCRRYFYPSLNSLNYVSAGACPVSEDISRRVLCLPLFPELPEESAERIASEVVTWLAQ